MEASDTMPELTPEEQAFADREKAARPKVDHPPETMEEVAALAEALKSYRAEIALLRQEIAASRPRVQQVTATLETPEQRLEARLAAIAEASHYCPGCGALGKYPQKCEGTKTGPHKAIEMVSTEELSGDPALHTRAPNTDELAA